MPGKGRRQLLLASFLAARAFSQPFSLSLLERFTNEKVFYKQYEIAKQLVAWGDRSVLPKLQPYLSDPDRLQRANAAFVFFSLGDHRGLETLLAILYDRSAERIVRPQSAGSYAGSPKRDTAKLLAAEIQQDRYYAIHLLGELKAAEAVPFLGALVDDNAVNYKAAWALGEVATPEAYEALKPFLWANAAAREAALEALKKFNPSR